MSEFIENRTERVQVLKSIITQLHDGASPESVKAQLAELVRRTDYTEIAAMEQQLMAEGMPVSQIQKMCDLHSQVTRDVLVPGPARHVEAGHPVDTFRRENQAIRGVILRVRASLKQEGTPGLREALNELMDIDKHYQRKEHALFPFLEQHGITGPSKVMWGKDDEIRALLKEAVRGLDPAAIRVAISAIEEMIYKEENILLPLALANLTAEEWEKVWEASPQYGWCLVEPQVGFRSNAEAAASLTAKAVQLPTGNLTIDQLLMIFKTLPVDLTLVDADDRVAFFSEGPHRVFARSKAIIGRKVQHCHPPRSVDVVNRILEDFRAGRQDVAEFWLEFQGRFVHVSYYAVRDGAGAYAGTLEVTQDATHVRSLTGERRLLQYD